MRRSRRHITRDELPDAVTPVAKQPRDTQATGFDPRERDGMAEGAKGEIGSETNIARQPLDPTHGHQYGISEGVSLDEIRNFKKP